MNDQVADLDNIDRAILRALAADGRISMTDLAQKVGLSKTPVTARVRRLEAEGVITGYSAQLSARHLGRDHVAFVEVRLSDTRESSLAAFDRAVRPVPEIEECHLIAGGFDYLMKVRTRDIAEYRRVLAETISGLPHLASTTTYFSMDGTKERGIDTV